MIVPVAAGVLRKPDGRVLIAQRPAGKIAAGRWEFPGGKIEPGESAKAALKRELREELGIDVRQARPLIRIQHAYPERTVVLHTWLITDWSGDPHGREDQALNWVLPARIWDFDLLEADAPIVNALKLPEELPVSPDLDSISGLCAWLDHPLRLGCRLMRLRAPRLSDSAYQQCLDAMRPALEKANAGLLIDRPDLALQQSGVKGLHLNSRRMRELRQAPALPLGHWLFSACHNEEELDMARRLGVHAVVLGAVGRTPTHPGDQGMGWSGFRQLVETVSLPVYAIGGLGRDDLAQAMLMGAQGVAGIRDYCK